MKLLHSPFCMHCRLKLSFVVLNSCIAYIYFQVIKGIFMFQNSSAIGNLCPNMPRYYKPKHIKQTDRTNLEKAFKYRVDTKCSIRTACAKYDVKAMTLQVS